jgi:uncharacterized SAM-dependent methyltransferase
MVVTTEDTKVIDKFKQDVRRFFIDGERGILWPYIYGAPQHETDPVRGGIFYNEMLAAEQDYYLYKYEAELFQTQGQRIADIIGPGVTFIELGPGSEQSLRLKTLPLLQYCDDLRGYFGIDISQSFLDQSLAVIRSAFPNLQIDGTQQDFTELQALPDVERSVIFFKGSTIANLTREQMPEFIKTIGQLANDDHYLLLVHDCNQDEKTLMAAYDTPKMGLLMENIMFRIARDCEAVGLEPEAFEYKPEWDATNHDFKHVLVAKGARKVSMLGETIAIEDGQKFHILSSFKYPVEVFKTMTSSAGYHSVEVIYDPHLGSAF